MIDNLCQLQNYKKDFGHMYLNQASFWNSLNWFHHIFYCLYYFISTGLTKLIPFIWITPSSGIRGLWIGSKWKVRSSQGPEIKKGHLLRYSTLSGGTLCALFILLPTAQLDHSSMQQALVCGWCERHGSIVSPRRWKRGNTTPWVFAKFLLHRCKHLCTTYVNVYAISEYVRLC